MPDLTCLLVAQSPGSDFLQTWYFHLSQMTHISCENSIVCKIFFFLNYVFSLCAKFNTDFNVGEMDLKFHTGQVDSFAKFHSIRCLLACHRQPCMSCAVMHVWGSHACPRQSWMASFPCQSQHSQYWCIKFWINWRKVMGWLPTFWSDSNMFPWLLIVWKCYFTDESYLTSCL